MKSLSVALLLLSMSPSYEIKHTDKASIPKKMLEVVIYFESLENRTLELQRIKINTDPVKIEYTMRIKSESILEFSFSSTGDLAAILRLDSSEKMLYDVGLSPNFTDFMVGPDKSLELLESLSKYPKVFALYKDNLTDFIWAVVVDPENRILHLALDENRNWKLSEVIWPQIEGES